MKTLRLLALLLVIPLFILSCHTPAINLRFTNNTGACFLGPCTLHVTGSLGFGIGPNEGADFLDVMVPAGTGPFQKIGSGVWTMKTQSICHNNTFTFNLTAGLDWTVTFFCGANSAPTSSSESAPATH